jgi:hypothetical protein
MTSLIEDSGAEYATVEDAAVAMMRLVVEPKSNGRALGIVPRTWKGAPNGYIDLEQ